MIIHNNTTLRGYLAHLHSLARQAAILRGSAAIHKDNKTNEVRLPEPRLIALWESLRTDLKKVLDINLVAYHDLALSRFPTGETDEGWQSGTKDKLRVSFSVLKQRADKARKKDPTIKLLRSFEPEPKEDGY